MDKKHSEMIWPIPKSCQIAYLDTVDFLTGRLTLRPYLNLHQQSHIWGIAVDGLVFKLQHETDGNWQNASALPQDKSEAAMPTTAELDVVFYHQAAFNATVDVLRKHKIAADYWRQGWYWSKEEQGSCAIVVDMSNGRADLMPKHMNNGYVRLISRKVATKPINIRFPLVYITDDEVKLSLDFRPELKDCLWGLQTGKHYCHLTNEPQKLSWNDAVAYAKQMSGKNVQYILPSHDELREVVTYNEQVNDALAILSCYGADVDLFEDKFWEYLLDNDYSYDKKAFVSYFSEVIPKDRPFACRLFAKAKKKPTVI